MSSRELFTREEALSGLPARRARFLLYLIETETARRVDRQWDLPLSALSPEIGAWQPALLEEEGLSGDTDESLLLAPFSRVRDRLPPPCLWAIERYAREWASLVPGNTSLRAVLGRLLEEKYRFSQHAIPGIRAALGAGGHPPGLEAVVGVVLMGYFIEMFVVQCAKAVLPRDPSGRSLIWGSVAGLAAVGALLCAWVFVVNGAVPPEALAGQRSSVFVPPAAVAGPSIAVLGSILVVLLPGLAVIRGMMGSFGMIREWLPAPPRTVVYLPRATGPGLRRAGHAGSPTICGSRWRRAYRRVREGALGPSKRAREQESEGPDGRFARSLAPSLPRSPAPPVHHRSAIRSGPAC